MNLILITPFAAIIITQLLKYPIAYFFKHRSASVNLITSTGGMPSSHSAAVSSLISSLIFEYGFTSPLVAIATVLGVIVMFDSMGVRRQSGEQGIVLDRIARHHLDELHKAEDDIEASKNAEANPTILNYDIKEYDRMIINRYLGHKPSEVIVGVITGTTVAIIFRALFNEYF